VLAGESAGGGLVAAAMVATQDVGEPLPGAGVCISLWMDMSHRKVYVSALGPKKFIAIYYS
jgi:monoterpene epsilon-lactone hydrolase